MSFVIMAVGSGTRFWPLSRRHCPKQFLAITGGKPMVVETYRRILPLADGDEIMVVVGEQHRGETERLFQGTSVRLLVEPMGRNTAPCIGLAAFIAASRALKRPMVVLPSDHYIVLPETFRQDLRKAMDVAMREDCIVTIGIVPNRPETGYGYIEVAPGKDGSSDVFPVRSFREKPDVTTATHYLSSGRYFWNAGIFVAKPSVFLGEIARAMPTFVHGLQALGDDCASPSFYERLVALYETTPNISFDYAVMERTEIPLFVVPSSCAWSDVGSWYSLYELRCAPTNGDGGNVAEGDVLFLESSKNLAISTTNRSVVVLGVENTLIVDTEDALLVANMACHQKVRVVTEYLAREGKHELL